MERQAMTCLYQNIEQTNLVHKETMWELLLEILNPPLNVFATKKKFIFSGKTATTTTSLEMNNHSIKFDFTFKQT
jgi:hypothetical protein